MSTALEGAMFSISQLFLTPVLLAVAVMFGYAFFALGAFLWQAAQRAGAGKRGDWSGHELLQAHAADPGLTLVELESLAIRRLELARIAARVAPMLGLVATMIPMGPALQALADGRFAEMAHSLTVAFSAVILALLAAAITYSVVHVRRRWYAQDLLVIERRDAASVPTAATVGSAAVASGGLA